MVFEFLAALAGQIVGAFIGSKTKEELESGKKYFLILKNILLGILIVFLMKLSFSGLGLLLGMVAGFVYRREYFYFGVGAAALMNSFNPVFPVLIFLYGLPYGTLLFKEKKLLQLGFNSLFFIVSLLVSLVYTNLTSLAAGALITILVLNIKSEWSGKHVVSYWAWSW